MGRLISINNYMNKDEYYYEVEWDKPKDIKGEGISKSNWVGLGFKKGHKHSKETRKRIGESHKGKRLTEEHKRAISLGNTGIRHSEESKELMRQKALGRVLDEATKKKIGDTQRGKTLTKEHANNIRNVVKGRMHVTDGVSNKFVYPEDIPAGFKPGRIVKREKK